MLMTDCIRYNFNSLSQPLSQRSHAVTVITPNSTARSTVPSHRLVVAKGVVTEGTVGHRMLSMQYKLRSFLLIFYIWSYCINGVNDSLPSVNHRRTSSTEVRTRSPRNSSRLAIKLRSTVDPHKYLI